MQEISRNDIANEDFQEGEMRIIWYMIFSSVFPVYQLIVVFCDSIYQSVTKDLQHLYVKGLPDAKGPACTCFMGSSQF